MTRPKPFPAVRTTLKLLEMMDRNIEVFTAVHHYGKNEARRRRR